MYLEAILHIKNVLCLNYFQVVFSCFFFNAAFCCVICALNLLYLWYVKLYTSLCCKRYFIVVPGLGLL